MPIDKLTEFLAGCQEMDWSAFSLPSAPAFSLIALLGYLAGHFGRSSAQQREIHPRRDLKRAQALVSDMEATATHIRKNLLDHATSIALFRERLAEIGADANDSDWQALCSVSNAMLVPTQGLAAQIAQAHDELRHQSNQLMSFSEVRTDQLTRISNRSSLDETLDSMFALLNRYGQPFSAALFDVDHFSQLNEEVGHLRGDMTLQSIARVIDANVRETDAVARYEGDQIMVVMPHTELDGAMVSADRIRAMIADGHSVTVSCGVTAARQGDLPASLLTRAAAALDRAKADGRNRVHCNEPYRIESPNRDAGAGPKHAAVAC